MKYESNLPSNRTCKKCGDEFLCSAAKIRKGHYICKPCSTVVSRSWANKNAARRAEKQKLYQSREETKRRKIEQFKNMALKAYRDLMAANKGIRRLKARLNKYEAHRKEGA